MAIDEAVLGYAVVSESTSTGRRAIVRGRLLTRHDADELREACEAQFNTAHWEGRPRPTRYVVVELRGVEAQ